MLEQWNHNIEETTPDSRYILSYSFSEASHKICVIYQTNRVKSTIDFTGNKTNRVKSTIDFTGDKVRNIAVYLLRQIRGESLKDIDELFNIRAYSTVSSIIQRVSKLMKCDRRIRKQIVNMIDRIKIGQ